MTRSFKQRILFTLAITVLALFAGLGCGYLLGCAVAISQAKSGLGEMANHLQERSDAFYTEAFKLLQSVNLSPMNPCSEEELTFFRNLIAHAEFVDEIGRMRDGQAVCTASLGRLPHSMSVPKAYLKQNIGRFTYLHYNFFPPREEDTDSHGISLGDYYVILDRFRFAHLIPDDVSYFYRSGDFDTQRFERLSRERQKIIRLTGNRTGTLLNDGVLYVTNCENRLSVLSCTTTYYPIQTAVRLNQGQVLICVVAGGLIGLLGGLFGALIYRRSLGMEKQLYRAIAKNQIQVVYQPIVELDTGKIVEVEALARWTDTDGFAISPAVFVPIAEQCGFVGQLTRLIVRRALRDLAPALKRDDGFRLNVNVTAFDLADPRFLPMLAQELAEAGVEARQLAIEITESSTARSFEVRQTISELRRRGHSVQIDDFGTGYSSLSYLHDLSIDAIKIDRTFTHAVGTEAVTVAILPQILAMAKALNLQVIAEGIETPEQAAYFAGSEMKILGQGWLFGRPISAERLRLVVSERALQSQPVD